MKPAIRVKNVTKRFRYWRDRPTSFKTLLVNFSRGKFNTGKFQEFHVLKDLSFDIMPGEFVGIMGRNGAGKSTLFKIISGIYQPNRGKVGVRGSIVPLIELGAGFDLELSGYENIFLNAAILGFGRKATTGVVDTIIDFAGLGDMIHMPVKNYSSGMLVRLAFSIGTHLESDILLIDEVLAVGDMEFQVKCLKRIHKLHKKGRTILFVTHDVNAVRQNCDRCLVIGKRNLLFDGSVDEGVDMYVNLN